MASKTERAVVNAAGLVQGIVLVTFGFTAVIAAAMALLSFIITRRRPAPAEPAARSAVPVPRSSRDHVGGSSDRSGAREAQ